MTHVKEDNAGKKWPSYITKPIEKLINTNQYSYKKKRNEWKQPKSLEKILAYIQIHYINARILNKWENDEVVNTQWWRN